ncbi:hypothetical protein LBMAG26_05380 [Bacteroidota bacterium]|nr:hypothetical protein LBMAG26_05380 [Bacteroidota bacterium]
MTRMKKLLLFAFAALLISETVAQTDPAIVHWIQNTTNIKGRHYVKGNSTPVNDAVLANVLKVQYSADWVYVSTNGIPSYITGPFLDGNPSLATSQNAIFKISLKPTKNTGTPTNTTGGNIGIFLNGVALFDYRDGVSWSNAQQALKGGPLMGMGDNVWNRDAVVGERLGFDCAKGHPAMGNYHHHQNPSAFNLDRKVISTVCDLYAADGLYVLDSTKHSPLLGYTYDGFPIYGAFGYKNADGTGGIARMKSSFLLRNITDRTVYADGSDVIDGPAVSTTYPLGYFREDYGYIAPTASQPDYLDEHNGRFCVTPEYPKGTYCYFATVDANWNSAYPYIVGPTFYGVRTPAKVTAVTETVSTYTPSTSLVMGKEMPKISMMPNPASEVLAVQISNGQQQDVKVELIDMQGRIVAVQSIFAGSTMAHFDVRKLYGGDYLVRVFTPQGSFVERVVILKD